MTRADIESIVLAAMRAANAARTPDQQLVVSPDAPVFGRHSTLDSLGLVALLIDVEDALADRGVHVTLSDERAMSQSRSPFRDVPSLVSFIEGLLAPAP